MTYAEGSSATDCVTDVTDVKDRRKKALVVWRREFRSNKIKGFSNQEHSDRHGG
ncbi:MULTISPECIES: hypothetical protein [unclassified Microcoleus]|uniref:hypothetical protein n=1 Tax=unclassified Microcoleus TaxID=2642155 RepID=UPI002FD24500